MATSDQIKRAGAWLAPSVVAACGGALAAGIIEVRGDLDRVLIAIGVIAPLAIPVLLLASMLVRALYAAWLPATLVAALREERGAMPRLAAWVGVVGLGMLGLAWAMFQGTWLLASWTAFKATSISFLAPVLALLALFVLLALSRPAAELFTIVARWIDRHWQRRFRGTLLSAPIIVLGATIAACGVGYLIWILLVTRRIPDLSAGVIAGVAAGVIATVLVHAAWRGPAIARAIGGGLIVLATIATVGLGVRALYEHPQTAIALWSESPLARTGLERVTDIEDVRTALPLDGFRPFPKQPLHRDLVLITLDGARAERTPPYAGAAAMPALASIARRGSVFEWAFASSSTERRGIPSLVTGIAPHRVRGRGSEAGFELDPRHIAIAERLRAGGYATAAFTCCFTDRAERTWLRGFEHQTSDADPIKLATALRTWVADRSSPAPMFVWIHLSVPWPADRELASIDRRLAMYDQGLATLDRAIAGATDAFASRAVEQAPIFVIAGTRGEELGEHGKPFGEDDLYNTQLRVPLVIVGPSIRAIRIGEAVSIVDVGPTLIELAGFVPPRGMASDGISIAPLLVGGKSSLGNLAFAAILPDQGSTIRAMTMIRGGWKLIDSGGTLELYDLKTDPDETANLAFQHTQTVAELRALLTSRIRAAQTSPF